jgi:hypothetical protein
MEKIEITTNNLTTCQAKDMAEVVSLNEYVSVAYGGSHKNCLRTREWTSLEPDVEENKYYAWVLEQCL